jgi:hypothetical protein
MKNLSPLKAIRSNCIDCSGGILKYVRECNITECPLYPFRMGKNPHRLQIMTDEQIENPVSTTENESNDNEP